MPFSGVTLTKQELKKQKDQLKRFQRYLPTLILKMKQLKVNLDSVEQALQEKKSDYHIYLEKEAVWAGVFSTEVAVARYVKLDDVQITYENLAGLSLPHFVSLNFKSRQWDLFSSPLWVDAAVAHLKERLSMEMEIRVIEEQRRRIAEELTIITQRVNLFEQIRIPETKSAIRRIKIYLGDYHTASVIRGKIAKQKLERVRSA